MKRAAKSVSLLWMGSLLGSGSTFITYIILARELGAEYFGVFGSALSMVTVFSLLAVFGVPQFWLKTFGKDGWMGVRWMPASLKFVMLSTAFSLSSLIIWSYIGSHNEVTQKILIILSFYIIGIVSLEHVNSKLQLEERYSFLALWQITPNMLRLIIVVLFAYLIKQKLSIYFVAWIYAFTGLVCFAFAISQIKKLSEGNIDLKGHDNYSEITNPNPRIKDVFAETWPFGFAAFFAFIYVQSDIIMVKYIAGDIEAGYYNVAFVIQTAIMLFPSVLYQKYFLPKYHRWANHDKKQFYLAYKRGNLAMLMFGVVTATILLMLSDWGVPFLFGKEYKDAVEIVNILAAAIPINYVAYSVGATLVTQEHMRLKVKLMGSVAAVNIVLNFFLIPTYYAKGAAIATVISTAMLLAMYFTVARYKVFKQVD